jgi:hypothetical protein
MRVKHGGDDHGEISDNTVIYVAALSPGSVFYNKLKSFGMSTLTGVPVFAPCHAMSAVITEGIAIPNYWLKVTYYPEGEHEIEVLDWTPPTFTEEELANLANDDLLIA